MRQLPLFMALILLLPRASLAQAGPPPPPPAPIDPDDLNEGAPDEGQPSPAKPSPAAKTRPAKKRKGAAHVVTNPLSRLGQSGTPRGDPLGYGIGAAAGAGGAVVGAAVGTAVLLGTVTLLAAIPPGPYADDAARIGVFVALTTLPFLSALGAGAAAQVALIGGNAEEWAQLATCIAGGYCAVMLIPLALVGGALGFPLANCLSAVQCGAPGGNSGLPRPVAFAPALGALLGVGVGATVGYLGAPAVTPPTAGSVVLPLALTGVAAIGGGVLGGGLGGAFGVLWDRMASGDTCAGLPGRACLCGNGPSRPAAASRVVRGDVELARASGAAMPY